MNPNHPSKAHPPARLLMDQALESEKGKKIRLSSPMEAYRLLMSCYATRKRDIEYSMKIHSPEDPRYGRSIYSTLTFWREDDLGNRISQKNMNSGAILVMAKPEALEYDMEDLL